MNRRNFLATFGAAAVRWQKPEGRSVFEQAEYDDIPLVVRGAHGLVTVRCAVEGDTGPGTVLNHAAETGSAGGCRLTLRHRLHRSSEARGEDLLEAEVELHNTGTEARHLVVEFRSSAHPSPALGRERVHLPLTANGTIHHAVLKPFGTGQTAECDLFAGRIGENGRAIVAHYREPEMSEAGVRTTRAMLLIPLADLYHPDVARRVALFCRPGRGWRVANFGDPRGDGGWSLGTRITLQPGEKLTEKCWLLVHRGGPPDAWRVYHRVACAADSAVPAWLPGVKVHYYDFLGPGPDVARRGGGYDADARHFREFHVGMATQHGYYPSIGDYLHPDRHTWNAMCSDAAGAVPMSLERMRARCRATREAGAKAAIYLHTAAFDTASPLAPKLAEAALPGPDGKPMDYAWTGPETVGKLWHMSMASPVWRRHLLQQARWVMELLQPDAIVVDETFGGLGYDPKLGPISPGMIAFLEELRGLVHSFGPDRAVVSSDCSLASFVLWADGEGGDHAYNSLLGHELYRQEPVRYLAALGGKPWLPCAWQFGQFWELQMDLARKAGAGVGVSNGWIEYTGLTHIPPALRTRMLRDIDSLLPR